MAEEVASAQTPPKWNLAGWWMLPLLCGLCLFPCLTPITCAPNPEKILASVPIGSRASELDQYLTDFYDSSSVDDWTSYMVEPAEGTDKTSKHHALYKKEVVTYEEWKDSNPDFDSFTGEITFHHFSPVIPDDLAPSYVVSFVYVDGVLKEKSYGGLPG